jgi:hypothetical protein
MPLSSSKVKKRIHSPRVVRVRREAESQPHKEMRPRTQVVRHMTNPQFRPPTLLL